MSSLIPRPLPDFILQLWRKTDFSPQLRDKIQEWPGDEASGCPGVPSDYKRFESCAILAFGLFQYGPESFNSTDSDAAYDNLYL